MLIVNDESLLLVIRVAPVQNRPSTDALDAASLVYDRALDPDLLNKVNVLKTIKSMPMISHRMAGSGHFIVAHFRAFLDPVDAPKGLVLDSPLHLLLLLRFLS